MAGMAMKLMLPLMTLLLLGCTRGVRGATATPWKLHVRINGSTAQIIPDMYPPVTAALANGLVLHIDPSSPDYAVQLSATGRGSLLQANWYDSSNAIVYQSRSWDCEGIIAPMSRLADVRCASCDTSRLFGTCTGCNYTSEFGVCAMDDDGFLGPSCTLRGGMYVSMSSVQTGSTLWTLSERLNRTSYTSTLVQYAAAADGSTLFRSHLGCSTDISLSLLVEGPPEIINPNGDTDWGKILLIASGCLAGVSLLLALLRCYYRRRSITAIQATRQGRLGRAAVAETSPIVAQPYTSLVDSSPNA